MDERISDLATRIGVMRERQGLVAADLAQQRREMAAQRERTVMQLPDRHLLGARRRDILEVAIPPALLAIFLVLFFSNPFRQALGISRVSIDPIAAIMAIVVPWRALVRLISGKPLVLLRGDTLICYGPFKRRPIPLKEIARIQLIREPLWWPIGKRATKSNYRLQIGTKRKAVHFQLSPSQVEGGLLALRRFGNVIAERMKLLGEEEG